MSKPMLTDEEIDGIAARLSFVIRPERTSEGLTMSFSEDNVDELLREAVRLTAERCAEICERDIVNRPSDPPANYFDGGLRHCAAAIREQIKGKPRPHFNPNEGFGPI